MGRYAQAQRRGSNRASDARPPVVMLDAPADGAWSTSRPSFDEIDFSVSAFAPGADTDVVFFRVRLTGDVPWTDEGAVATGPGVAAVVTENAQYDVQMAWAVGGVLASPYSNTQVSG